MNQDINPIECGSSSKDSVQTKDDQKAIELGIIKNNLTKHQEEAVNALMGLLAQDTKNPLPQEEVWKKLGYPHSRCLEKPFIRNADKSIDFTDICRIVHFDQARSMISFIKNNLNPKSTIVDCMGGFGHLSMAFDGEKNLEVVDHLNNSNKFGERNKRMDIVRKNLSTYCKKFEEKTISVRGDLIDILKEQKEGKVVMVDARLLLNEVQTLVENFCSCNFVDEMVLKLPIHHSQSLSQQFAERPFLRGIGMIFKCTHPHVQSNNTLVKEEEIVQLVILKKQKKEFAFCNNNYTKNSNDQGKKYKRNGYNHYNNNNW